jgi:hypothetical protein
MSDKKVLTKEIAEQFFADEDSVDLSEFTAIEDEAAEVLASSNQHICLEELTECSPRASILLSCSPNVEMPPADSLCMFKAMGRPVSDVFLHLAVLKLIGDELASELENASSLFFELERHEEADQFECAAQKYRVVVSLRNSSWRLTKEIAEAWTELDDNHCDGVLDLVHQIEEGALQPIIGVDRELEFSGIGSLPDETATELGQHSETVTLWGLRNISDSAAEGLSACKGDLRLDLDNLPGSAAAILSKHPSFADED